jgi:hypothetical protein
VVEVWENMSEVGRHGERTRQQWSWDCGGGVWRRGATNVEGEGGKRVSNHGGGKVAKEKLQTWHLPSNKM